MFSLAKTKRVAGVFPMFSLAKTKRVAGVLLGIAWGRGGVPVLKVERIIIIYKMHRVYVAHDIEKAGVHMIKYPVVSVGFVVADDIDVIEKRQFNISVNWYENIDGACVHYGDFEKRTVDEFWNRIPIDPRGMQANAKPAAEAWAEIRAFIDALETEYADAEIIFLTDNNSFDTANIDYNLELYTGRAPMRFSTSGVYRAVINADDMFSMMSDKDQQSARAMIAERVTHSHNPTDDAHYIYEQYIFAAAYRASHASCNPEFRAEKFLSYITEQNAKNRELTYDPTTAEEKAIVRGIACPDWNMTEEQAMQRHAEFQRAKTEQAEWDMSCTPNDSPPGTPRAPMDPDEVKKERAKCDALLAAALKN
jgi:hypothetical protein